jgi:hypothetical protein
VARLLDELAGLYHAEKLGALAHELSMLIAGPPDDRDRPTDASTRY